MKIMIFSSFGGGVPNFIVGEMKRLGYEFPRSRYGEIIDVIEQNAIDITSEEICDELFRNNPNAIYRLTNPKYANELNTTRYYGYTENRYIGCAQVVDIDTSIPHTISEYDGSESIITLPKYECVDETANLWSRQ